MNHNKQSYTGIYKPENDLHRNRRVDTCHKASSLYKPREEQLKQKHTNARLDHTHFHRQSRLHLARYEAFQHAESLSKVCSVAEDTNVETPTVCPSRQDYSPQYGPATQLQMARVSKTPFLYKMHGPCTHRQITLC